VAKLAEPDWAAVREQFPALANVTWLNTATYGQTPRSGAEAIRQHLERRDALACSDFLEWFDDADRLRDKLALLVNAPSGRDIAFCPSASHALSWLMNGIDWQPGDRVISLVNEFPNNTYFPSVAAQDGVEFLECDWNELGARIEEAPVRLVLLSSANYASGLRPDLEGLSERVHRAGGLLYVDGTQSVGALHFDAGRLQPDMLSVNAYKWMNTPNGAGFAYIASSLREQMRPTTIGWRSDRGWRSVDQLSHGAPVFDEAAERYEGGMLNFPSLYAMEASVDLVLSLGMDRIEARVLDLADRCCKVLESFGGEIAHRNTPILAARFEGHDPSAFARTLKSTGVHVSARYGRLRVSTHFYNNESDLERLGDALGRAMRDQRG
jgi:selenocysteine lyase/cysteine desulfurase